MTLTTDTESSFPADKKKTPDSQRVHQKPFAVLFNRTEKAKGSVNEIHQPKCSFTKQY